MNALTLDEIIERALAEDLGDGDVTSLSIYSPGMTGKARLLIKDEGILAGIPVAQKVFSRVDPSLQLTLYKKDGDPVKKGDIAFEVEGSVLSILSAERLVLNFMQRLSGIATSTARIVSELKGTKAKVLDTRKTTPNLRELEKYAVRTGGGFNHRFGLFDMVLIKDNHVDMAGGVINAIKAVHRYLEKSGRKGLKIEIEVRNLKELEDVLEYGGIDRIMMDNFTPENLTEAVHRINGRFETEASGGIKQDNIRSYAMTGVDFISVGALTHNFRSLDMSLKVTG
ncbi:MAG: carboxylating nicotinate-nucleotide diphosphorylase [Bacteroidota bacterium]|nr:carboxylating nicotinate-nucleotide diphosphorylase [Bacteroidota bacterium]